MTHKRTQIRAALVTLLWGLPTAGANVFASRLKPLSAAELPAILVSTGGEEPDGAYLNTGLPVQRFLAARLDIVVKALAGFEDTADQILAEIEGRIFGTPDNNGLGGVAHYTLLASILDPEMDGSADKPEIRLPVILRVAYS